MIIDSLFWIVPVASLLALGFAWWFFAQMKKADEGTDTMKRIAQYVRQGAMSYLKQQYKVVGIVFIVLSLLFVLMAYGFDFQNGWTPFAFLTGGIFSGLAVSLACGQPPMPLHAPPMLQGTRSMWAQDCIPFGSRHGSCGSGTGSVRHCFVVPYSKLFHRRTQNYP